MWGKEVRISFHLVGSKGKGKGADVNVEITWVLKKENLMGTSIKVMSYEGSESVGKKEGREVAVWKR